MLHLRHGGDPDNTDCRCFSPFLSAYHLTTVSWCMLAFVSLLMMQLSNYLAVVFSCRHEHLSNRSCGFVQ